METIYKDKKNTDGNITKIEKPTLEDYYSGKFNTKTKEGARVQTIRRMVPREQREVKNKSIIIRKKITSETQTEIFTKKRALFELKLVESNAFLREKEFVYCATIQIRNETYFIIPEEERLKPMSTFKRNGFHWFEWPPRETGLKIIDRKNINGRTSGDVIRIVFVEISKETDQNC